MESTLNDVDLDCDHDGIFYTWQNNCMQFVRKHSKAWKIFFGVVIILAIGCYIAYALYYSIEDNIAIIVFSGLGILFGIGILIKPVIVKRVKQTSFTESQNKYKNYAKR